MRKGAQKKRPPEALKGVRIIFPCSRKLQVRIDASWHRHELMSRSAAIRRLLELGLGAEK